MAAKKQFVIMRGGVNSQKVMRGFGSLSHGRTFSSPHITAYGQPL